MSSRKRRKTSFQALPVDCLSHVLLYIHTKRLPKLRSVSSLFNLAILNPYTWTWRTLTLFKTGKRSKKTVNKYLKGFLKIIQPVRMGNLQRVFEFFGELHRLEELCFSGLSVELHSFSRILSQLKLKKLKIECKKIDLEEGKEFNFTFNHLENLELVDNIPKKRTNVYPLKSFGEDDEFSRLACFLIRNSPILKDLTVKAADKKLEKGMYMSVVRTILSHGGKLETLKIQKFLVLIFDSEDYDENDAFRLSRFVSNNHGLQKLEMDVVMGYFETLRIFVHSFPNVKDLGISSLHRPNSSQHQWFPVQHCRGHIAEKVGSWKLQKLVTGSKVVIQYNLDSPRFSQLHIVLWKFKPQYGWWVNASPVDWENFRDIVDFSGLEELDVKKTRKFPMKKMNFLPQIKTVRIELRVEKNLDLYPFAVFDDKFVTRLSQRMFFLRELDVCYFGQVYDKALLCIDRFSVFPNLEKLTLTDFALPRDYMRMVAGLKALRLVYFNDCIVYNKEYVYNHLLSPTPMQKDGNLYLPQTSFERKKKEVSRLDVFSFQDEIVREPKLITYFSHFGNYFPLLTTVEIRLMVDDSFSLNPTKDRFENPVSRSIALLLRSLKKLPILQRVKLVFYSDNTSETCVCVKQVFPRDREKGRARFVLGFEYVSMRFYFHCSEIFFREFPQVREDGIISYGPPNLAEKMRMVFFLHGREVLGKTVSTDVVERNPRFVDEAVRLYSL